MEVEIRVLGEQDAAAWWNLRLEALQTEPSAFGKAVEEHLATPVEEIAARFRNPSSLNFTLGAFDHEQLVGMATFVRATGVKDRHKGHIYGVFVTTAGRGMGVGRRLIAELLERAKEDQSLEQVLLAVGTRQEAARRMYAGFGFEIFGMEPNALKVGAEYVDEEHMILRIRSAG